MLVLNRKIGQRIRIGTTIEVTVLSTRTGQVKLGFAAPQNVRIRRQEAELPSPAPRHRAATALEPEHTKEPTKATRVDHDC
ncbi:MAG: carbon storage regulator [Planctomycetes bacterium]|nr:carbon storage regulator [Planctomycetota bacterium]